MNGTATVVRAFVLLGILLLCGASRAADSQQEDQNQKNTSATQNGLGDVAVTLLADWIIESRDSALAEGSEPVPTEIRSELAGYVATEILDAVRWRIGGGSSLSLQLAMFRFGDSPAITLDHVIVFESQAVAEDPRLWVHELMHVMQFKRWGVAGFAARYIDDYAALEAEAVEFRWQWMKLTDRLPASSVP